MGAAAPITLVRRTEARPVLRVLRDLGSPTGKLLTQSQLPESFQECADGFVPLRAMLRFVGHAAGSQDLPDLAWRGALSAPIEELGGWGAAVARCATLRSAIRTFCERYAQDAPFVALGLAADGEHVWLWRRRPTRVLGWPGDEDGQQFMLAAMVRTVRTTAGPSWIPPRIRLESTTASWVASVPKLAGTEVERGCPLLAIAIPFALLARGSSSAQRLTRRKAESKLLSAPGTLAGSLQHTLASLLPAVAPSIEVAAEFAELSPRTLRRRLADEATSWRKVVDEARVEACYRLMRDWDRPLGQIAIELGYSDQAHLNRAFRRWTGETPSACRKRLIGESH